ncbi:MAG: DUF3883 domain-containing protein [Prevotella sp.]|nr:DUF3883 domain-containing protein [Prevotella sp.]
MKYSFIIDEKSLFRGVYNDYKKGQSATVHTPLNQSQDKTKWRNDIYDFINGCKTEDKVDSLPKLLEEKCLLKTTSKASGKITHFYLFSNFSLDGVPFDVDCSFAMYVKEETSKNIMQRNGNMVANTHFGRQKLHYPIAFAHMSDGYNIDNRKVLDKILEVNGGFAYVVDGFDYDTETKILNFKTTIIGIEGVLLSNVFKRKKGVGLKLLVDGISMDQPSLVSTTKKILTEEENKAFFETLDKIQESSRSNGQIGEEYVYDNIKKILGAEPEEKNHISKKYPQSPFDIECIVDGEKKYIEVKSTASDKKAFYMSKGERKFMDKYEQHYLLVLVTNVKSKHKKHSVYERKEIMNSNKMEQEYQNIKFIVK